MGKKLTLATAAFALVALGALLLGRPSWRIPFLEAQVIDPGRAPVSFKVEIDGVSMGEFLSVEGLGIECEVIEDPQPDGTVRKRPGRIKYGDITLKKGYAARKALVDWINETAQGKLQRKSGSIVLYSGDVETMRYNFFEAWPCKWTGPRAVSGAVVPVDEIVLAVDKATPIIQK